MVLLVKVTDTMDDDELIIYDLDDPKQNEEFGKYCQDVGRMGEDREAYPGDRIVIECIRRDE